MDDLLGLFDTHCHLDDSRFDHDREAVIDGLLPNGVVRCLTVGSDLASSQLCSRLAAQFPHVYASAGIHPHVAAQAPAGYLDEVRQLLAQPGVVAVGEIGLDYHYNHSPRDRQMQVLNEQLDLACALKRPAIIHVREAHGDMLSVLRARKGCCTGGIIHCFSGSVESAEEYVSLGYYISFAGPVTFANAMKLRAVAASVPLDRLLIETDSPYLTPVPFRGKRNEPRYVRLVCDALAQVRGIDSNVMADITHRNALRVFGIDA